MCLDRWHCTYESVALGTYARVTEYILHRIQKEGGLRSLATGGPVDTGVLSTLYIRTWPEYSYNPHNDRPPRDAGVGYTASFRYLAVLVPPHSARWFLQSHVRPNHMIVHTNQHFIYRQSLFHMIYWHHQNYDHFTCFCRLYKSPCVSKFPS